MRSGGSLFEGRERGSWNGNELQHWLNFSRFSHSADFLVRERRMRERERERGREGETHIHTHTQRERERG